MPSRAPTPDGLSAEAEITAAIIRALERTLAREYPAGSLVRRDAHPKHHGLVRAQVDVRADVPTDLRHGVFARPATFDAWIRFSNGSPRVQADHKPDQRGMAIKLLGVPGPKLLPAERDARTQDFVLASAPRFFIRDARSYAAFVEAASKHPSIRVLGYFFGWNPIAWRIHEFRALTSGLARTGDLLATRYWSQVPSRLGPHVVKYSARPLETSAPRPGRSADFLRERLAARLANAPARFEFLVQRFVDERHTPVEDASIEWSESVSHFERAATITIPVQRLDAPGQMALAEQLSFTPWHSLPEHEPIGAMNRIRRGVYEAMSTYRHQKNGVRRREPESLAIDPDLLTPQRELD